MKSKYPGGINPRRSGGPNGSPLYPGGRYGQRKEERRRDADERQEARDARSPQEQLKELDRRLGPGVGAVRERTRLEEMIKKEHSHG